MLSIDEARAQILEALRPLPAEEVPLAQADGRVLAQDVRAAHDVPPFANSAMDGYAVAGAHPEFTVVGESRAGAPFPGALADGEAIAISTGAAIPQGATAVVPVERVAPEHDAGPVRDERPVAPAARVRVQGPVAPGSNVRAPGEDLAAGALALARGARIGPVELGLAASAGRAALVVARRPRVAIVATGDELVAAGAPLGPGQIHDSNALALAALAQRAGARVVAILRAADERPATEAALAEALGAADLLLVSGGVSVGPHDHVRPALAALGVRERFWRVALRPGKPTWFGTSGERLVIGLPGNPVSALVTFTLFARPALHALQGAPPPPRRRAPLAHPVDRHPGRDEALRVRFGGDGTVRRTTAGQGSHQLTSLRGADALALVPRGEGALEAGTPVELELL